MTPQTVFESCGRQAQVLARAEVRRIAREQLGFCSLCGIPVAWHFNERNEKLDCLEVARRRERPRFLLVLQHAAKVGRR